ncbi:Low affinity iron permease-domain-containing protein [Aspergillus pseudonomiae]|uniref:Low affinity iron permease-domain-containing protein n=1 Tax=Aspergillus pseudonomiae TaxID=1506151 RepID=A0A5N7CXS1_9EURO|nr:Low affinity iron permease-domain-containing protein [Aspergillus pseudonomiae]KAE8398992.1 Low affinity iron permease-domain-containing protein [Aspergillus pseudonomiae]
MDRFMDILRKPGAKPEIQGVAPTQHVDGEEHADHPDIKGYVPKSKPKMLDRWLDFVVRVSGSEPVFFLILAGLLTWALLGIKYGSTDSWQVLISDIQAIVSYIFDSFLVRQQLNAYEEEMVVAAELESRILSHKRMLAKLCQKLEAQDQEKTTPLINLVKEHQNELEFGAELPTETLFGRTITWVSHVIGHLGTIILFWAGVFTWIGLGHLSNYSDKWQLYMNSASSALMVFVFAFLANIRERHAVYTRSCLDAIFHVDASLEAKLRQLTHDTLPNDTVIIPAPRVSPIQRAIFYYADFVGTLVGIAILVAVIIIWIAIGPLLHFDSNWWLLIGTYAGLVGMNDGFVLRNMQARLRCYVDAEFARITAHDASLFATAGIPAPSDEVVADNSLTHRVSVTMGRVCAHEITVVLGVVTILGLVAGASAMRWTLTGQLLCNVPPSLIESFFMIVLVTGHNSADDRKRVDLRNTYTRRMQLLGLVNAVQSVW